MGGEFLSLDDQRVSSFLADRDDFDHVLADIRIEEHSILSKEPKFPLSEQVRPQGLKVPALGKRIHFQTLDRSLEDGPRLLTPEPAEVLYDRLPECHLPGHIEK